ncbi:MAG: glyoxalase/bleomycin resistance/extradiol dioxygenase family protein [Streptococcaceae bacterium]|jgi:PhnB protein|nr:glyoxalase/bleomycin resistance/extradiol dioxygenase family protein [Streptococcaceae bacterium]
MAKKLIPYIGFDNAKEALEYYSEVFGDVKANRISVSPEQAAQFGIPEGVDLSATTMHASFEIFGEMLYTADDFQKVGTPKGLAIALSVTTDDEVAKKDLDALWEKAVASGKVEVEMPFAEQFWGGKFGSLIDKYSIRWQFAVNEIL